MARMEDQRELRCSFCGKMQAQVQRLIAGPGVCICNECVELCQSVLMTMPLRSAPAVTSGRSSNRLLYISRVRLKKNWTNM